MSKLPQLIIRTYLRRWPLSIRASQFKVLEQYSWLKPILKEIRTDLFPPTDEEIAAHELIKDDGPAGSSTETIEPHPPLKTRQSTYTDLIPFSETDVLLLLQGLEAASRLPVIIQKYRSPTPLNRKRFKDLERLSQPDNHPEEDLRIIWPIEAYEDLQLEGDNYHYYLVFKAVNKYGDGEYGYGETLTQWLAEKKTPLTDREVRRIFEQLLQSLRHLHHLTIRLVSGQPQTGLPHGNLLVDSVICVKREGESFFYLSDFAIWRTPLQAERPSDGNGLTASKKEKDLTDLGEIGRYLCRYQIEPKQSDAEAQSRLDPQLSAFLDRLGTDIKDADTAWYEWLKLPPLGRVLSDERSRQGAIAQTQPRSARWPWLAGAMLLALLAAGGWWWLQSRRREVAILPERLADVPSLEEGDFTYAVVANGRWSSLSEQLLFRDSRRSVNQALETSHEGFLKQEETPELNPAGLVEADSIQEAIDRVGITESLVGDDESVDFAVVPLVKGIELSPKLGYEIIAYDGLSVVVPFSYAYRQGGLAEQWDGKISLKDIRRRFTQKQDNLGTAYMAEADKESFEIFNREVFSVEKSKEAFLNPIQKEPTTDRMLQAMLENFESSSKKSSYRIGFAPLSSVIKQCSVYPLAVSSPGETAISPLVMASGEPITPETDLCDDKTLYQANFEAFRRDRYPLAYPIVVVFPRDNSRAAAGPKFAEMMRTTEAQQLLLEAGLVPVVDPFELADKELISDQGE